MEICLFRAFASLYVMGSGSNIEQVNSYCPVVCNYRNGELRDYKVAFYMIHYDMRQ